MATKIYKIETDNLEEGLKKIKEIFSEEEKKEPCDECDDCEKKESCELEIAKHKGKDFLSAIFQLLLIQIKEEYHDDLRKKYKEFFEEEYAWIVGDILRNKCQDALCSLYNCLNNKELQEDIKKTHKKMWVDEHEKRKC